MAYIQENDNIGGGGFGGFGGFGGGSAWAIILLVILVVWILFRDRHGVDGCADGLRGFAPFGFDGFRHDGCGCELRGCRPAFHDESNFEEERNLEKFMCNKFDRVYDKECKIEMDIFKDGMETRKLIESNYVQELRDKLTEKASEIATLKSEMFTTAQIGALGASLGAKIEVVDEMVERLACELPKRPPVFATTATPCATEIVTGCGCDRDRDFRGHRPFGGEFPAFG